MRGKNNIVTSLSILWTQNEIPRPQKSNNLFFVDNKYCKKTKLRNHFRFNTKLHPSQLMKEEKIVEMKTKKRK